VEFDHGAEPKKRVALRKRRLREGCDVSKERYVDCHTASMRPVFIAMDIIFSQVFDSLRLVFRISNQASSLRQWISRRRHVCGSGTAKSNAHLVSARCDGPYWNQARMRRRWMWGLYGYDFEKGCHDRRNQVSVNGVMKFCY
jgi:hypothetical protein